MLVVYYSWSNGNTKKIAEELAEAKNTDIAEIKTVKPYEGTCNEVVERGYREVEKGFKPAIRPPDKNPDDFDIIAVGTPTWWY